MLKQTLINRKSGKEFSQLIAIETICVGGGTDVFHGDSMTIQIHVSTKKNRDLLDRINSWSEMCSVDCTSVPTVTVFCGRRYY